MFLYITHPVCQLHDSGNGHPESPLRLQAIDKTLQAQSFWQELLVKESRKAKVADVLRVYSRHYWSVLEHNRPENGLIKIDADTSLSADSLDAALYASGAVLDAIDLAMRNEIDGAFCSVRPPGHHAELHQPMGFCLINHVAIGAAYALQRYDLKQIVVLDFDVHHGNGTESYAEQENRVHLISSFEKGIFPFASTVSAYENIIKLAMPAGTSGAEFLQLWEAQAWPALQRLQPDLILVSAGFDAHRDDPLAHINLTAEDFALWANRLNSLLPELGNPKVISVLEGGYHLQALADSVSQYIQAMMANH